MYEDPHARLRRTLESTCGSLSLTPVGPVINGRHSAGRHVQRRGESLWLRVSYQKTSIWGDQLNISGTLEANTISGVMKPRLLESHIVFGEESADAETMVTQVEIMTYMPGQRVSDGWELTEPFDFGDGWWFELKSSLDNLAHHRTPRGGGDVFKVNRQMEAHFGHAIQTPDVWQTEHTDLHWANVLGPELAIVDWSSWGREPAGYGAASLYVAARHVPKIQDRVYRVFADVLTSRSGQWCIQNRLWFVENLAVTVRTPGSEPPGSPG